MSPLEISRVLIKAAPEHLFDRFPPNTFPIESRDGWSLVIDDEMFDFFGLQTAEWLDLAAGDELIYACREERSTEFLHIRGGVCLREYRKYDGEVHDDRGTDPDTGVKDPHDIERYIAQYM